MDRVKILGELALATRLKRLSDRLTKDVSLLYKKLDIDFEAKWFTIISVLKDNPSMSITDLAINLGITHTAVNLLAEELIKKGYITSLKDEDDERQRLLRLSAKGRELCIKLAPVWEKIRIANEQLIQSVDPNFLRRISEIEQELDNRSMYERVWLELFGKLPGELKIIPYNAKMKKYFRQLNYEWLEEYFTIEEKDENILQHPREKIINNGGSIYFALLDEEVVGTCALIRHADGKFELAKMAVSKKYRSRGIGYCLLQYAIRCARERGAKELFLLTNHKLIAANVLYRKFGFKKIRKNPFNETSYERKTYTMKIDL